MCACACMPARLCVQTCKQGSDCTTCEIEHPARVSVCMWSACGRLGVAMEILGKASSRRRLGSSSLHHLGILTLWLRVSCRIFTHLTSHVPPPPSFCIPPFYLFPSLYSLEFVVLHTLFFYSGFSCDSNAGGGPQVNAPLKMWFPVQLNWLMGRAFVSCILPVVSETH